MTNHMDPMDTWRDAFRTELRAEAIGFAWHGWPVVPGTFPEGSEWVGRPGAPQDGPVPVHDDWARLAGSDPAHTAALWSGPPFTLLLATGITFDVLDVPAELGRGTAARLRTAGIPVPIAATPAGRWFFPVLAGGVPHPGLREDADVVLRGAGDWVPLPPSPFVPGVVHWRVKPEVCGWQVPRLDDVQYATLVALRGSQRSPLGNAAHAPR